MLFEDHIHTICVEFTRDSKSFENRWKNVKLKKKRTLISFSESLTSKTAFHVDTPNIANENTPVTINGPVTCQSIIV